MPACLVFFNFYILIYSFCFMCVLPVCMYTSESSYYMPGVQSSEGALDTMKMEFQIVVNHQVGAAL